MRYPQGSEPSAMQRQGASSKNMIYMYMKNKLQLYDNSSFVIIVLRGTRNKKTMKDDKRERERERKREKEEERKRGREKERKRGRGKEAAKKAANREKKRKGK